MGNVLCLSVFVKRSIINLKRNLYSRQKSTCMQGVIWRDEMRGQMNELADRARPQKCQRDSLYALLFAQLHYALNHKRVIKSTCICMLYCYTYCSLILS